MAAVQTLCADEGSLPTFRTDVNEVVVNFVIRDGRGRYVRGLSRSDIRIFENGAEQDVVSFSTATAVDVPGSASGSDTGETIPNSVYLLLDTSDSSYPRYVYMIEA